MLPGAIIVLSIHQVLAALSVPIMFAEEPLARKPAGPFDAVKVVVGVEGQIDIHVFADPPQGIHHRFVFRVDATVVGRAVRSKYFSTGV